MIQAPNWWYVYTYYPPPTVEHSVHDTLIEAHKRIADPVNWAQQGYAQDAEGKPARCNEDATVKWSALAAIHSVRSTKTAQTLAALERQLPKDVSLGTWESTCAHEEMMAAFNAATKETS